MYKNQIIFDVLSKEELEDLIGKSLEEVIKNNPFNHLPDQELLTREEACMLLKVDSSTLWRWTNQGKIIAYGIGSKRFYKKEELLNSLIQLTSKN
ncbi:MAG: helix-turn-helix domain-containing protein [Flavobacteriaceae bacterium]|nr:helix-turn-helix domain-containing protein [Flavobacteriaceae bacterium]